MPKSSLKCAKCGRTFSMPAHLARHMSAGHGTGGASKTRAAGKRGPGRPTRAAVSFGGEGAGRIAGEIHAYVSELSAQRDAIDAQIEAMSGILSMVGSTPSVVRSAGVARRGRPAKAGRVGGGGRRPEGGSLRDFVLKVLRQSSSAMGVKDISGAVIRSGYKTASKDLSKAISNLLPQVKEVKKVDRGMYKA